MDSSTAQAQDDVENLSLNYLIERFPQIHGKLVLNAIGEDGRIVTRLASSHEEAAYYAKQLDDMGWKGVYVRTTTVSPDYEVRGQKRGAAEDSYAYYAMQFDMDLHHDVAHKPGKLPRPGNANELEKIRHRAGLAEPTGVTSSGYGRYWTYQLAEPIILTPEMMRRVTAVQHALAAQMVEAGKTIGFAVDNVRDLARVFRIPGTHNRKVGSDPRIAEQIRGGTGKLWTLEGLEAMVRSVASPAPEGSDSLPFMNGGDSTAPAADDFKNRPYSEADALAFIEKYALAPLREAAFGSQNNQINESAMVMAHFKAYGTREQLESILLGALPEEYRGHEASALLSFGSAWDAHERYRSSGNLKDGWSAFVPQEPEKPKGKSLKDRLLTVEGLLNLPLPKPLIKGVLDLESATWLIAQPSGFKSFVALDWSCHVATGKEWRGRKTRQAPVVYVLAEGKGNFRKRVQAWISRNEATPEQLYILPVAVQARGKDKTVSQEWLELVALVKEIQPGLIVLDTQARLTVGMEENNATEMGVWVNAVDALKEAVDACVLVVHHTGRNGGDARGSSALDGAQDAEWRVDRKSHQLAMTLSCDKNKDGDDRTAIDFVMDVIDVGTDEDGLSITSLVLGASKEHNAFTDSQETDAEGLDALLSRGGSFRCRDLVLSLMRSLDDGQGLSRAEICRLGNQALKEHPVKDRVKKYEEASYRKALQDLTRDGQLELIGGGRNSVYALP